jgi:hypothetical protein
MKIDTEKLIAEIERLSAEHTSRWETDEVAIVLDKLEDFIISLQQEQPNVDLDVEIEKELRAHYNDDQDVYWWNYLKNSFRHFYELGRKGNKEPNKKLKSSNDSDMGSPWRNHIIEEL